jgi:serine/threonine-protein kinase
MTLERLRASLADRYRLERELGQGGMATVYLAQDLKHDRKVAIKVLKPELAAVLGAERFVQEIKTTAALQHPHILPLFDSGKTAGRQGGSEFLFYVMPYVEGETIREKLNRETQFGVDEAVRIAREVADALDYAHRQGVIHRDIKPENILLHDGRPMVMDFGIALAVSAAAGGRMTETGLSLGTPHYMSPEQATADRAITARSDIYSLASVCYEMLTGEPPHMGTSAQQIIMKIVTDTPRPVTELRKSVPAHVAAALAKALEKLPADRFSTAGEFAQALIGAQPFTWPTGTMPTGMAITEVGAAARAGMSGRTRALVAALALVAVAGVSAAAWLASRPVPEPVAARFALALPDSVAVGTAAGTKVAISRDGSRIAILGQTPGGSLALYLRRADDPVARLVRGSEQLGFGYTPRFSPDGEWLIFATAAGVRKVPAAGGTAQTIGQSGSAPSWGDGGTVVFVRDGQLWIGSAEGRDARLLASPDTAAGVYRIKWPHILPGAEYALVVLDRAVGGNLVDSLRLGVMSLRDGSISDLGVAGTDPQYSATGHIVFGRAGGLVFAAPFSLAKRAVTGPATLVLENVWQGSEGATSFAVSDNGTLVYQRSTAGGGDHALLQVDAEGRTRQIPTRLDGYWSPQLSPDGQRLAVGTSPSQGGGVWLVDIATGARERLGAEGEQAMRPEWTRDGTRVLLLRESGDGREIVARSWNRSVPDHVLLRDTTNSLWELAVGPGGSQAVLRMRRGGLSNDLFVAPGDSLGAVRSLVATAADETSAAISSDGRLLAYASDESGILEVYVQPFPGPGARVQVSVGGGAEPIWSNAGSTLFYRGPSLVLRAELGDSPIQVQRRDTLFPDTFLRDGYGRSAHQTWDVFPGDREFLMIQAGGATGSEFFAVVNWPQLRTIRGGER